MTWRRLLALHPTMVDFDTRGFRTRSTETRSVLEAAAGAFLAGFNAELDTPVDRAPDLSGLPSHRRGFAAEGAAMAAVLLDSLNPTGGRRYATLDAAYRDRYDYLMLVGAGWAMAKLRRRRLGRIGADEPLLRFLAYDGLGFCRAFFQTEARLTRAWVRHPRHCDARCDIRYQGLGRSLWFRECGDPVGLASRVAQLPARHRGDAWSGIALAAAYAGGVDHASYPRLRELAGEYAPAVAQGAAFAAEAWRRSGQPPEHAYAAVEALAGTGLADAAGWTWAAREELDRPGADATDYRQWRLRVQAKAFATT